jgi:4-amino-4-deoxy-L-arabinose transferase-like glycosyltransferase
LLAGILVRFALWLWLCHEPLHIWDEQDYNRIAKNLVEDEEFSYFPGKRTSIRPPLFPAFVAGVYRLFGQDNYAAVRLIQAGLSLLTVLLLYKLGTEISSRRAGIWSAGLYCFYPSMLAYNNLLLTEVLFTFLLCSACYLVVLFFKRRPILHLLATGVVLGLAALTRSVLWLFPPLMCVFLLLTSRGPLRGRVLACSGLMICFIITIAPWAVRNTRLEKTLVFIDTMGGRNFMMGNYRHTPLYRSWDAVSLEGAQSWDWEVCSVYPPSSRPTQGALDKLALRQGLRFVSANPGLTVRRDLVKLFDFWGLERELIAGAGHGFFGDLPRVAFLLLAGIIVGGYSLAMLAAIFGAVMAPPGDKRVHWFFLLVMAFIWGMHTLVFAHSRYHLPLMPLVLVYTASAVVNRQRIWQARWRRPSWLAGGLSLILVLSWVWSFLVVDMERFLKVL